MSAAIALVTARAARGLDEDLPPLKLALHSLGAEAQVVDWDDTQVDWASFDLALLRSTWDYAERLPELRAIHPDLIAPPSLQPPASRLAKSWTRGDAIADVLRGRLTLSGPGDRGPLPLENADAVTGCAADPSPGSRHLPAAFFD